MGHKVKMLIEVDCENMAFSLDDPDSVQWFGQDVLMNQTEDGALYLHSNEVGDTVGRVRVLVVHDWPPVRGWLCSKCGTDRTKAECPKGHSAALTGECPMVGTAA